MFGCRRGNGVDVEGVHVLDGDAAGSDIHAGLRRDFKAPMGASSWRGAPVDRRFIEDLVVGDGSHLPRYVLCVGRVVHLPGSGDLLPSGP